jgi:YD repeat-containing protein
MIPSRADQSLSSFPLRIRLITILVVAFTSCVVHAQTGPVQYGYDELGRLIVVADGTGNAAIYDYDAVGNLLSIQRIDPGQLSAVAIIAIAPAQGRVGSTVSIFGKGFGATPGQNIVSFNGGVATVTSASPVVLRVVVPPTARDGPITVTAPAGSETSAQSFRITGPLIVTPATTSIWAGESRQFGATTAGGSPVTAPIVWTVNDVVGGNASVGTLSSGGFYASPYLPSATAVTVAATEQGDPTTRGFVALTIVPSQLAAAAQGVSVTFAPRTVTNSLQASASVVVGGTSINKNVQATVSTVVGGTTVNRSVNASASVVRGGEPSPSISAAPVGVSVGPIITGVSPAVVANGATAISVTLTGSAFQDATQVTFLRNNAPDTSVAASLVNVSADGTQAIVSVSVVPNSTLGARVMQITTASGTSTPLGIGMNVLTVQ